MIGRIALGLLLLVGVGVVNAQDPTGDDFIKKLHEYSSYSCEEEDREVASVLNARIAELVARVVPQVRPDPKSTGRNSLSRGTASVSDWLDDKGRLILRVSYRVCSSADDAYKLLRSELATSPVGYRSVESLGPEAYELGGSSPDGTAVVVFRRGRIFGSARAPVGADREGVRNFARVVIGEVEAFLTSRTERID